MDAQGLLFGTAAVFLLLAVVGGGVSVKEVVIPKIPNAARVALAMLGICAAVLAVSTHPSDPKSPGVPPGAGLAPGSSSNLPPCRHPVAVPPVADGGHTEEDARRLLSSAGLFNVVSVPKFEQAAPKGIVIEIAPSPGSVLCPRETVTITVTH